ncbi:hypothetical protein BKK51_07030 [Rodentibacter trehalosifermentans]|uniref:Uncharacterized protein n=1 Tax=Rodentibacter trehalosifermentans TaxID=1908263 RepID=A0A1V3ISN5_9PAST|nr:hypothetical protein [Rodentibacter trehalosifermentans]OOF45298.1 hypothetical protein BKK51_07030 [Rodentibacter trehalosifermentans]
MSQQCKSKGVCPFCLEEVQAKIIEENTLRRDKCQCPNCNRTIFICRKPGCNNYAKGGEIYDDELCPGCTSEISGMILPTVVMGIVGVVTKKLFGEED